MLLTNYPTFCQQHEESEVLFASRILFMPWSKGCLVFLFRAAHLRDWLSLLTKGGVICQQSALRALVVGGKVEQRVADACGNVGAAFASARNNECEKVPVTF